MKKSRTGIDHKTAEGQDGDGGQGIAGVVIKEERQEFLATTAAKIKNTATPRGKRG